MGDINLTAADIRPLTENGAVLRKFTAGGAITVGDVVYIAADGDVEAADANAGTPAEQGIGIAVESKDGETSISANDPVSVCLLGPVAGFSGMTPGDVLYVSNTAGKLADAAGSFSRVMGKALTASIFWVNPEQSDAASS